MSSFDRKSSHFHRLAEAIAAGITGDHRQLLAQLENQALPVPRYTMSKTALKAQINQLMKSPAGRLILEAAVRFAHEARIAAAQEVRNGEESE